MAVGDPYDPQAAQYAGLWQGLQNLGGALVQAGTPVAGRASPGLLGGLGAGGAAFGQGMRQGQQAYREQAQQEAADQRQRDFAAATGASDTGLTSQQLALRNAIPAAQRGVLGALGPQQGMQVLGGLLGRAPAAPQTVAPGGALVGNDGRVIYQAPERPQQPQWVGTPETGYGWASPPSHGGGGAPVAPAGPAPAPGGGPIPIIRAGGAARAALDPNSPTYAQDIARINDGVVAQTSPNVGGARPGPNAELPGWDRGLPAPRGGGGPGFSPVIPARPAEVYRPLTATEQQAQQLPENGRFQINTRTGQISPIGGSQVTVNNNPGESAYERERGKALADEEAAVRAAGRESFNTTTRLNRTLQALDGFTTGPGSSAAIQVGAVAQRLGIPDSVLSGLGIDRDSVASGEIIRSLTAQALQSVLGSGQFPANNFSNADREMLERSMPSLGNSPQGNRLIIAALQAQTQKQAELGRSWTDFSRRNGAGSESFVRWSSEVAPEIRSRDVMAPILGPAQPPQAAPIPGPGGQGTAAPPPAAVTEGTTARNQQTGARIQLRGGQWVPMQ